MRHYHNKASGEIYGKRKCGHENISKNHEESYYRSGSQRHWPPTCHTLKHLIKLYQASLKEKEKEINFI